MRRLSWMIPLLVASLLAAAPLACKRGASKVKGEALLSTGLALSVSADPNSDVAAVRFSVDRTSCAGESISPFSTSIVQVLPGFHLTAHAGPPGAPVAPGSLHLFSDLYLTVDAGCYDVVMAPLDGAGQPSAICSPSFPEHVIVTDGQTTEVTLFSQCESGDGGAADLVNVLNHPPAITTVDFTPSKFLGVCAGDVTQVQTICATASDPDGDPLAFTWSLTSGAPTASGPTVRSTVINPDGSVTQCVQIVPGALGQATFTVLVKDLVKSPVGPGFITWEEYFDWIFDPKLSRDALSFPAYAVADPNACAPDGGTDGGCPCACGP